MRHMSCIMKLSTATADTHLFRPAHGRERPESRREPGIKDILVLLKRELRAIGQFLRTFGRLSKIAADDPVLAVGTLEE